MDNTERIAEVMLELAEKFGLDLEDEADLQTVGRMIKDEHPDLGQLFSENLRTIRDTCIKT